MPNVNKVVGELCRKHVSSASAIRDTDGHVVVRPWLVRDAQRHFLAHTARYRLHRQGIEEKDPLINVEDDVIRELDVRAANDKATLFPKVTSAFERLRAATIPRQSLNDVVSILNEHGLYPVRRNRAEALWLIIWGLATLDTTWLDDSLRASDIDKIIERRLWKLERMRYRAKSSLNEPNMAKKRLRIFAYPGDPEVVNKTEVRGGQSAEFWDRNPSDQYEFWLKGIGSAALDPVKAIRAFFLPAAGSSWDFERDCTLTYCDKVIHILHLDEFVEALVREKGEDAATAWLRADINLEPDTRKRTKRFAVVSSFTNRGTKNDDTGAITRGAIGAGGPDDPYFESVKVRMDQLIPGDHFILDSHPAYNAFAGEGDAWRLENALITGLIDNGNTSEPHFPRDLEVQGHGLGPCSFGAMQGDLIAGEGGFRRSLESAQNIATGLLTEARVAIQSNRPYQCDRTNNESIRGVIEFRHELAPETLGTSRDLTAFWGRWLIISLELRDGDTDAVGAFATDLSRPEYFVIDDAGRLLGKDSHSIAGAFNLPYIRELELNEASRQLTIRGLNLTEDQVSDVYFVSEPLRYYDQETNSYLSQTETSVLLRRGQWTEGGETNYVLRKDQGLSFPPNSNGKECIAEIPASFNPPTDYWRPVVRVLMAGVDAETDIRSARAFRWPPANQAPFAEPLVGHGYYNVAYFPLFKLSGSGAVSEIRFTTAAMAGALFRFYRKHEPYHKVRVIRPGLPGWFGETFKD